MSNKKKTLMKRKTSPAKDPSRTKSTCFSSHAKGLTKLKLTLLECGNHNEKQVNISSPRQLLTKHQMGEPLLDRHDRFVGFLGSDWEVRKKDGSIVIPDRIPMECVRRIVQLKLQKRHWYSLTA